MRSKFFMELTSPEVEKYLAAGGKTAILPIGCTEMHGPHQPLGSDTIEAKATALLLAEGANGIVLPDINYSWAGSTDGFPGTISIGMELLQKTVEAVFVKTMKMGFKRFVIISVHGPNALVIIPVIRLIYEKYLFPAVYIDPYYGFCEEAKKLFEGEFEEGKEASLVLAGLKVLGQPELYSEKVMQQQDHAPEFPQSFLNINKIGRVGYFMQDPRQHACPSSSVSLDRGMRYLKLQVESIIPILEDIDIYTEFSRNQQNKGWNIE